MDDALRQAKAEALQNELDTIHFANKLYWATEEHTHEATAGYQRRQERLEQIRIEMQELKKNI
jgi:hypothetical protein